MAEMKTQYITFTKPVIDGNAMHPKTFHIVETNDPVLGNIEVESVSAGERLAALLKLGASLEHNVEVHKARSRTHCNDCGNKLMPTAEFVITGGLVSEKDVDPTCWSCA